MPEQPISQAQTPKIVKTPEIITVGRIVHYVDALKIHRAAIATRVGDGGIEDSIEVHVFGRVVQSIRDHVPFDPTGAIPHSWHWCERDNGLRGMPLAEPAKDPSVGVVPQLGD